MNAITSTTTANASTLAGKILFPPFEGWNPAGLAKPSHQFSPFLEIEGMTWSEPLEGEGPEYRVTLEVNGQTRNYRVVPGIIDNDDDAEAVECTLIEE